MVSRMACIVSIFLLARASLSAEQAGSRDFFEKYTDHYQDICIGHRIYKIGVNICDQRFSYLRPLFESFDHPFSVLDLGACEGYFSFRTAREYPATCHMIEGGYYGDKPNKLLELCNLNRDLNVSLMQTKLNLNSLEKLSQHDHFDVVLAFLVIHQMAEQKHTSYVNFLDEAKKYLDVILRLGNYVVVETSTEIYPELDSYVERLCLEHGGKYLGEVPRYRTKGTELSRGRFFLFTSEYPSPSTKRISPYSFEQLNGVFHFQD